MYDDVTKRTKILMGVTLSEMGGAQKVVYDIIESLPLDIYDIGLVTAPGGELIKWIEDLNKTRDSQVKIITIPELRREISPFNDIKAFFKLYSIMKRGRYHIVHLHSSKMGILGRWAAKLAGVPKILFTVHGWGINEYQPRIVQKVLGFAERISGRISDMTICVSRYHLDKGIKMGWLNPSKSYVIYNGISDAPDIYGKLKTEIKIMPDTFLIGTIMRLRAPKEPLFTIRVVKNLIDKGFNTKLVIIGDGPLKRQCMDLIKELALDEHVFLLGTRHDVRELLNDFNIITLFTRWEGLPVCIIEAMFAGIPVITCKVGGIPELIGENNEAGFMLDSLDIEEAASYIECLLKDNEMAKRIGSAAKQKAYKLFTKKCMTEKYHNIYEGTLGGNDEVV